VLNDIQAVISDPENIPDIPNASAQYLNVRCNASYLIRTGVLEDLRKAGYSESFIGGFLEGMTAVTEIIELMQEQRNTPTEED